MQQALELIIDEATPGHFFWTLVKQMQAGEEPFVIDFAMGPLPSEQAALAAGTACLARHRSGGWGGVGVVGRAEPPAPSAGRSSGAD